MYGLRGLGLNCPGDPGCPGNVQPDVAPAPDVQQQIADVWSYLWSQPVAPVASSGGGPPSSFTQTVNANAGKIAIGAGVFLALILFAKAGR